MSKILNVNCRNLGSHLTGVQRYTSKILTSWSRDSKKIVNQLEPYRPLHGIKGHIWEQTVLPFQVRSNRSILWSPSNTGPLIIANQVVTIHDTVPFDHPEWLNKRFVEWYHYLQPKLTKKVRKIITISEFSKERIIHHFNISPDKVEVIYNGVELPNKNEPTGELSFNIPFERYILCVGSIEPRKNISRLIKAWSNVCSSFNDIGLIVVGAKGLDRVFSGSDENQNHFNSSKVFFTGHVTDEDLANLYTNASGFCYPSLYEGFGLPPLEAMSFNIPVLTSNTTAMKEICNGAAILVDPYSVDDISDGICKMLCGKELPSAALGLELAQSLTWDKCAEATWNAIFE